MVNDTDNWTYKLRTKGNTLGGKNKPQKDTRRPVYKNTEEEDLAELETARLNTLTNLSDKLDSLSSSFIRPASLDFQPNSNKLSFNNNNAPFIAFEDALTRFLIELDGVQSEGLDSVRTKRKELVRKVETELSKLDEIKTYEYEKGGQVEKKEGKKVVVNEGKELPDLPKETDEKVVAETDVEASSSLKRADESEDRYTKVRKQDPILAVPASVANSSISTPNLNDLPLFARLPSRFD